MCMKFSDLFQGEYRFHNLSGKHQWIVDVDERYELSIICGGGTYSMSNNVKPEESTFEVALLSKMTGMLVYRDITNNDVLGRLTYQEVLDVIKKAKETL